MSRARKPKRKSAKAPNHSWDDRMEAAQLNRMADALLSIPFTIGPKPETPVFNPRRDAPLLPLMPLSDSDRWQIADYLRSLAQPRVLQAIRRAQTPPGKRGVKPKTDGGLKWRAALELELYPKRPKEIAHAWGLPLQRLYETHKMLKEGPCLPHSWRHWSALMLAGFRAMHRDISPSKRRAAFVEELRTFR